MHHPAANSAVTAWIPPWLRRVGGGVLLAGTAVAIWLSSLFFLIPSDTSLDSSWQAALVHAWTAHLAYGREVVFTYGPWGWLTFPCYNIETFAPRMGWELGWKAIGAGLFVALTPRLTWPRRIALIAFALLIVPIFNDTLPFIVIAGLILWLMLAERPHPLGVGAAGVLLGLLAQQKFSYFVLWSCGVTGLTLHHALARRGRLLAGLLPILVGSLLFWWVAAGQSPSDLPLFVQRSLWVSSGYTEAMFVAPTSAALIAGVSCCVLYLIVVWEQVRWPQLPLGLTLTGFGLLGWKHGFVRADGHMLGFFTVAMAAGITTPLFLGDHRLRRTIASWTLIAAGTLGCIATSPDLMAVLPRLLRLHLAESADRIFALDRRRVELERLTVATARANSMPAVRAAVGLQPIDQFGYQQSVLLFNHLNYRPRPSPQSYQTYNGPLARLNENFGLSDAAPAFTLARLQTIDNRLAAMDDARCLAHLILDHDFVVAEHDSILLRRHAAAAPLKLTPLRSGTLTYGSKAVDLPLDAGAIWVRLDPAYTLLGWLRTILYQPPLVTLVVVDDRGFEQRHRIVVPAARDGFLLSPRLQDTNDLAELLARHRGRTMRSFRLEIPAEAAPFFRRQARYETFKLAGVPDFAPPLPVAP